MRLTRVYFEGALIEGAELALPASTARHLVRVLRMDVGAALCVFNGKGGEYDARITAIRKDKVNVRVGAAQAVERESSLAVTLLQGVARGDKMDLILQKATELGVTRIVPLLLKRSTVRLDTQGAERKHAHWQSIIASACEQCGRNRLPILLPTDTLANTVSALPSGLKLLLAPDSDSQSLPAIVNAHPAAMKAHVVLLVGPEGGFDPEEAATAQEAGFVRCRLGPRILRTETAALAALATLQSLMGDFAQTP
jgi:16S rRNA (uracil1498-N3)-methyltransferase